jgi:hypothetical protein
LRQGGADARPPGMRVTQSRIVTSPGGLF